MGDGAPAELSARRFAQLVIGLMALGFLALLVIGGVAAKIVQRTQEHGGWVVHTYEVDRALAALRLSLERMQRDRSSAVHAAAVRAVPDEIARIAALTTDNPRQQARIPLLRDGAARLHRLVDASASPDALLAAAATVERLANRMIAEENRLLAIRTADQRASAASFPIVLAAAAALLLIGGASIWVIRRYTADLLASRNALRLFNANLEESIRARTTDLQRANDEIQRFAYIVSHDLRSPLVNVMGFTAELETATTTITALIDRAERDAPQIVTPEVRLAAREDLPEAIGFIRTSTQKMDRLINAILRLSREGRRSLTPETLDMDALAHGIADSLRHRTAALGARIDIARNLPSIQADRVAIEQILSNLIENSVKYLKPGRPGRIEIRGHRMGSRAVFEVVDNGRGIDPRDHERIFDLFRRSGAQDQPGEGIGLAHVRALAYRLGGIIDVESTLGAGSTFRVNLPVTFAGEQEGSK